MTSNNAHFSLANSIKVVAIDLDGVVYRGKAVIEGADAAISSLRRHGLQAVFVTNSSVRTRADIAEKLRSMGIPAEKDDVLTSAYVAGLLIDRIGADRTLVVGEEGLKDEIVYAGAMVVAGMPCDVVLVGMDTAFSYEKIRLAMDAIAGGAVFVACNRDASFPGDGGRMLPGCGSMVAAVESAVGFPPRHIAGKPSVLMLELIAARYNVGPNEILVVGDSMESDIAMATAFGSPSVLVAPSASEFSPGSLGPSRVIATLAQLPWLFEGKAPFFKPTVTSHEAH